MQSSKESSMKSEFVTKCVQLVILAHGAKADDFEDMVGTGIFIIQRGTVPSLVLELYSTAACQCAMLARWTMLL